MKKIMMIALFMLLFTPCLAQQKIQITYFNVPPFIIYNVKEQRLTGGALYDFLEQYIGPEIGVEFVWSRVPSPIARQLISIENGSADAIALLSYSPERAERFLFTDKPYFIASPAIAVLKTNPLHKINTIEDILPLKIGYGQKTYLSPFMRDKRINFDMLASGSFNEQNIKKLILSRIDAVYTPDIASLLITIKNLNHENEVKVMKLPDKTSAFHVVFAKELKEVARQYDAAFDRIDGKKIFLHILGRYIDVSKL